MKLGWGSNRYRLVSGRVEGEKSDKSYFFCKNAMIAIDKHSKWKEILKTGRRKNNNNINIKGSLQYTFFLELKIPLNSTLLTVFFSSRFTRDR